MELIVAVYDDWGIGRDGTQPIALSADRTFFRETTRGSLVIAGRRTIDDFPGRKPLPGRVKGALTRQEMEFLVLLGQVAFLPVARKLGDETPVYLEDGPEKQEQNAAVLQLLEKKGLIDLDYDRPLKGADPERYAAYPIQGSIALTRRGQQVLELLEYQGYSEEDH